MTNCPSCGGDHYGSHECPFPKAALDAMARKVLDYHPKPKSKPAKARKRRAAKIAKAGRS